MGYGHLQMTCVSFKSSNLSIILPITEVLSYVIDEDEAWE